MASKKSKAVGTDAGAQLRFTAEEDEQIIDLVRSNECLFNVAHKQYKNNDYKHRLWNALAAKQNRDGESILHICNFISLPNTTYILIMKKIRNLN